MVREGPDDAVLVLMLAVRFACRGALLSVA